MQASNSFVTAGHIANCLRISPQAVRKALVKTPTNGVQIIAGREAAAWSIDRLPESLSRRLTEEAQRRGYRDASSMLLEPPKRWEPPLPLDRIRDKDIAYANKLRDVLRPRLARGGEPSQSSTEMEAGGTADYFQVFKSRISGRYWRQLFARTLQRDGGAEDWNRLEIYLPNNPKAKDAPGRALTQALAAEFGAIESYIKACGNPANPSKTEQRAIWTLALDKYASLVGGGMPGKRAARRVRSFLFAKAPFLAPSRDALLKAFDRKLSGWKANGVNGLIDRRKDNGEDGFSFPQQDVDLIEAKMVFQYGAYDPAWREAWAKGELSEETRSHYCRRGAGNSQMPRKLISILGKRPIWLYTLHRRRRDFNSMKAHFDTVYDGLHTLDCISADDVTLPVWFWHQPDRCQPPVVTRGQCLVYIDLVSKRILGWSLQPEKNYNALVIYTETARVLAEKGLCRALLFEHGIWEKAKIITGSNVLSVVEVTQGLREFGIEFFHADSPEGKWEIEQVMGLIQNRMEGEPGYCGRDERKDRPDWIKKQLAEVQSTAEPARKIHPSKYFYSFEQWNVRLGQIFEEYNAAKQGGRLMRDRSPDQIYIENWNADDPPMRIGAELLYLFFPKYEVTVGIDGITIASGRRQFKYFGPELRDLVGYKVLLWFNPQFPDLAVVTDLKRNHPIGVPLHDGVPRLERLTNPDGTRLAEACERREGQVSAVVARYNVLKDKFELPYRKNLVAAQALAVGQKFDHLKTAQKEKTVRVDRMRRQAQKLEIPAVMVDDDPKTRLGIELLAEAARDHQRGAEEPKVYQLDPGKTFKPKGDES